MSTVHPGWKRSHMLRVHAAPGWIWPTSILLLGLALRLAWAHDTGYPYDVPFFVQWMRLEAQQGIGQAIAIAESSYPPLSVYLLWLLGLFNPSIAMNAPPALAELLALRLASAFFDLLTIALLYRWGQQMAGHKAATWAALLYAICPGGIYLSGWWVQIDAWFVLPMILGAWWLSQRRIASAWLALGLAATLKLQAVILLPIFVVGTWHWCGLRRLALGILVLAITVGMVAAPFLRDGQMAALLSRMTQPLRAHQWITMTSHNLWYVLTPAARTVGHDVNRDQNVFAGGVSFHDSGLALLALGYSLILARLFVRSGPRAVLAACAAVWFAFFMVATRTHVRYIFPSLALMLCAGFYQRRWWLLYGAAATTLLLNLVWKSLDISPLASLWPLTGQQALANAWINVLILALISAFYALPLSGPACRRADLEGTLSTMRKGRGAALLGAVGIVLAGSLAALLVRGRAIGIQIAQLRAPLRASLNASLNGEHTSGQTVAINWPHVIQADHSAYLGGIMPVTPPALFLDRPETIARDVFWVQYPPWQQSPGLEIEYYGTYVTEAELSALVQQAERVVAFDPNQQTMFMLARRFPGAQAWPCLVSFEERVCLVTAHAVQPGSTLQLQVTWKVIHPVPPDVTVFVHIVDPYGNLVAQADGDPAGGLLPFANWNSPDTALYETRLADIPPGNYRARIGVYNRISGERLNAYCKSPNSCADNAIEIVPDNAGP